MTEIGICDDRIRALASRARALTDGLDAGALNWRPEAGRWSVGECLAHLDVTHRFYLGVLPAAIRAGRERGTLSEGPFRYGWFDNWFLRQVQPPVGKRFKAPAKFAPPRDPVEPGVVSGYLDSLGRLREVVRSAEGLNLAAIKVASPVSKLLRFRLGAAFRIVVGHAERHTVQAENVRESPAFPGEAP